MNDTEQVNNSNRSLFASGTSPFVGASNSRRANGGVQFSSQTSGLVDVFAQVFAQMSAPIAAISSAPAQADVSAADEADAESNRDSISEHADSVDQTSKENTDKPNSARDAALLAIAAGNQRPAQNNDESKSGESTAEHTPIDADVNDGKNAFTPKKSVPSPSTASSTNADTPSSVELAKANDQSTLKTAREGASNTKNASDETAAVAPVTAGPGQPNAKQTGADKTVQPDDAEPGPAGRVPVQAADAGQDKSDGDSRRSGRRNGRNRDDLNAIETQPVEPRSASADAAKAGGETTLASVTTSLESSATVDAAATSNGSPNASAASTAIAASTATIGPAPPSSPVARASSSSDSSSEPSSAIQSTPNASGQRSGSSQKTSDTSSNSASDAVTRAKLVQRVSKAFQHLGVDGGIIRLRLAPAELGSVRVEMQIQGRKVNARVVAETEAASKMLREHLPDLRSRLEAQGMQIERIEVETDENSFNPSRDSYQQNTRDQQQSSGQDNASDNPLISMKRAVSRAAAPLANFSTPAKVSAGVDIQF